MARGGPTGLRPECKRRAGSVCDFSTDQHTSAKSYLAEVPAGRAPGTLVRDETDYGHFTTLVATADGLAAIEPGREDAASATQGAQDAPEPKAAPKGRRGKKAPDAAARGGGQGPGAADDTKRPS